MVDTSNFIEQKWPHTLWGENTSFWDRLLVGNEVDSVNAKVFPKHTFLWSERFLSHFEQRHKRTKKPYFFSYLATFLTGQCSSRLPPGEKNSFVFFFPVGFVPNNMISSCELVECNSPSLWLEKKWMEYIKDTRPSLTENWRIPIIALLPQGLESSNFKIWLNNSQIFTVLGYGKYNEK